MKKWLQLRKKTAFQWDVYRPDNNCMCVSGHHWVSVARGGYPPLAHTHLPGHTFLLQWIYPLLSRTRHTHPPRRDLIPEIPTLKEKTWHEGYPSSSVDRQTLVKTFPQVCRLRLDNDLGQWSNKYMKGVGSILLSIIALRAFSALK